MAFVLTVMGWLGETIITSLIDKLWDQMKELIPQGGEGGECAVGDALSDLEISLIKMQPIISKAENMWIKDENLRQNVNKLLVLLKDAAYNAEDLLDKFQYRKQQRQIKEQHNGASHPMKRKKVEEDNDHDNVNEINKIQQKLDNISNAMEKLLDSDNRQMMKMIDEINRVTSSIPVETQVFGRDNELKEIMRLLLEQDQGGSGSGSGSDISIRTITGMGGVGKTTLAQEVYNDKRVEEHFDLRIWACVSEDFSVERLTKEIYESATKQNFVLLNFNQLQVALKENITSKKFLLVLDDVWNEDSRMWDSLCAPLMSGIAGSKILVTTRNEKIANMIGSVNPIHLDGLDDDDSWAFFKKCAFGSQNSREHPSLEAIAKEMVPKLKGLPLAARTLGGLLNMKMNEQHWKAIMDSEIWKLPQEEHGVLLVLQLSYRYLPAHLKRCFVFCSLYPKNYQFDEQELVRIWMAEGFLPAQENITMEDFGSVCFQELVSRSFFQKSQRVDFRSSYIQELFGQSFFQKSQHPNRYVMHDLIHDLAQLISGGETYRLEDGKPFEIPTMLRHLNVVSIKDDTEQRRLEFYDLSKLRTLIYPWQYSSRNSTLSSGFFNRLHSIHTLILKGWGLREMSESIGHLIHLRYLDISSNSEITKLPDSLFNLYNLQALMLKRCDLHELPDCIGNLFYLRYLDISSNKNLNKLPESLCRLSNLQALCLYECSGLRSLPQGMSKLINLRKLDAKENLVSQITEVGKLTSLQSLPIFMVGKEHGRKLAELSGLTQLHRMLKIKRLENVEGKEEAIAANLHSKLHLDELLLQWTSDQENDSFSDPEEEALEHLQPNSTSDQDNDAFFVSEEVLEYQEPNSITDQENDAFSDSEEVLEHLWPNSTLERLTISGYRGARSPSWLKAESLSKLETLNLEDCKRWDDLSFIRNLSNLKSLILKGLSAVKIRQELFGSMESNWFYREWFPCLSVLEIFNCPLLKRLPLLPPSLTRLELNQVGLTEFPGIQEGTSGSSSNIATAFRLLIWISKCPNLTNLDQIECFSCLTGLSIEDCPLLTRLPPLSPSLVELKLVRVGLIELPRISERSSNVTTVSLSRLHIEECSNLISLEQGLLSYNLPKLRTIFLKNCGELLWMPMKKFKESTYLGCLSIENCPKLMSMAPNDEIHLPLPPSIWSLKLSNCGKVGKSLPSCLYYLTALHKLELCDCPHFASLPREPLLHLEQLHTVHLLNCNELRTIEGLGVLKSLKILKIHGCPRLQSIEEDEQGETIFSRVVLHVNNTTLLKVSPLRNILPSIETLEIESSTEVNMFEGVNQELLRCLTSLRDLTFHNCKHLQSLPTELHSLPSLWVLKINKCKQIQSLPEKGLPISLMNLLFYDCHSTLEKQLKEHLAEMKRSGRYFPIVNHKWEDDLVIHL